MSRKEDDQHIDRLTCPACHSSRVKPHDPEGGRGGVGNDQLRRGADGGGHDQVLVCFDSAEDRVEDSADHVTDNKRKNIMNVKLSVIPCLRILRLVDKQSADQVREKVDKSENGQKEETALDKGNANRLADIPVFLRAHALSDIIRRGFCRGVIYGITHTRDLGGDGYRRHDLIAESIANGGH